MSKASRILAFLSKPRRKIECAHCHRPTAPPSSLIWEKWHCEHCNSLLTIDRKRRVLLGATFIPFAALMAALTYVRVRPAVMGLALLLLFVPIYVVCWLKLERTSILIAPGHCTQCDYNLTGNISGICPECGTTINKTPNH